MLEQSIKSYYSMKLVYCNPETLCAVSPHHVMGYKNLAKGFPEILKVLQNFALSESSGLTLVQIMAAYSLICNCFTDKFSIHVALDASI